MIRSATPCRDCQVFGASCVYATGPPSRATLESRFCFYTSGRAEPASLNTAKAVATPTRQQTSAGPTPDDRDRHGGGACGDFPRLRRRDRVRQGPPSPPPRGDYHARADVPRRQRNDRPERRSWDNEVAGGRFGLISDLSVPVERAVPWPRTEPSIDHCPEQVPFVPSSFTLWRRTLRVLWRFGFCAQHNATNIDSHAH